MIRKYKQFLPMTFTLLVFFATYLVMKNVVISGDDFYYASFSKLPLSEFCRLHKAHYFEANGRAIVHILDTIFLGLPFIVWQLLNSFFLAAIVFFIFKIAVVDKKNAIYRNLLTLTIITFSVFYLHISMTRQSVYWITGSFNYVYPFFLFILFWYLITKTEISNYNLIVLCLIGFLSAATTEQNAMITIGLVFMYVINDLIVNKRINKKLIFAFIFTLLGALTVFLAPATFYRYTLENEEKVSLLLIVYQNIKYIYGKFIISKAMIAYQILFILSSSLYIIRNRNLFASWKRHFLDLLVGLSPFIIFLLLFETKINSDPITVPRLIRIVSIALYFMFTLISVFVLLFKNRRNSFYKVPIISIILSYGAQIMMLISPIYGERNILCSVFLLIIYVVSLVSMTVLDKPKSLNKGIIIFTIIIFMFLGYNRMVETSLGYKYNKVIDDINLNLIETYKKEGASILYQYKLIDDQYGWSMPYISKYHLYHFKLYHDLPIETEIEWLDK